MSEINGVVFDEPNKSDYIELIIKDMSSLNLHKNNNIAIFEEENYSIGIGSSVYKLKTDLQYDLSDDPLFSVSFKGEIYNYKELRQKLVNESVVLKTKSENELIIRLYEKYGIESFAMLDGAFAFSIYDKEKKTIIIARDFFGKKPIYYFKTNDSFFWSSKLESLIKTLPLKPILSKEAISIYFQLTYIPAPYTIYENIYKVESNHYLIFNCDTKSLDIKRINQQGKVNYWDSSFDKAKETVRDLVQKSVKSSVDPQVRTGTFLSGGVDSSIVSLCYSKLSTTPINTFSLGFDNKRYDETNKSKIIARLLGSKHHEFILQSKNLIADIDNIITNFEEPFADSSALPSYFISSKASKEVKRVLTGDGGDEVFGGYNKYYMGKLNRNYIRFLHPNIHNIILELSNTLLTQKSDKRGVVYKINRLLKSIDYEGNFYYNIISLGFQKEELKDLLLYSVNTEKSFDYYKNKMSGKSHTIHDFRQIDKMISLEGDMIVKVSKTSDLANIESHSPLLSKDLWLFSNSLPESFLMKGWNKKYILKEAFKEYFPKGFFENPKKGFGVPVGDWLRKELKDELMYYCSKSLLKDQGLFNLEYINKLVSNHIYAIEDNTFKVWSFFCCQKWYFNAKINKHK